MPRRSYEIDVAVTLQTADGKLNGNFNTVLFGKHSWQGENMQVLHGGGFRFPIPKESIDADLGNIDNIQFRTYFFLDLYNWYQLVGAGPCNCPGEGVGAFIIGINDSPGWLPELPSITSMPIR